MLTSSSGCAVPTSVNSNTIYMAVFPVTASIAVSPSPNDTVCAGTTVTYAASVTGGVSPAYTWYVNGSPVSGASGYSYIPSDMDSVRCVVNTGNPCVSPATISSNTVNMTVFPWVTPAITITPVPNDTVCAGTTVTYSAATSGGGVSPGYQWYVNGAPVIGSTTYSYVPGDLDSVRCLFTSSAPCSIPSFVNGSANMKVDPHVTPAIVLSGTTSYPAGSIATVTAIVSGTTDYSIRWMKNGTSFAITTVPVVTYVKPTGTDTITANITDAGACSDSSAAATHLVMEETISKASMLLSGISIYPNPTTGVLFIDGATSAIEYQLLDLPGKKIMNGNLSPGINSVDVAKIPSGIYILEIIDDISKVKYRQRIIKY